MLSAIIKYFFVLFCCLYTYQKLLNVKKLKYDACFRAIFALVAALVIIYIRAKLPLMTLFVLIFFMELFSIIRFKTKFTLNFCASILSFAASYSLYLLSAIILSPLAFVPFLKVISLTISNVISCMFVGILQTVLMLLFFKIKRFKNGIPNFISHFSGDIGVALGMLILVLASTAYIDEDTKIMPAIIIFFTVITGVIFYLWYRRYITNYYMDRIQKRNENILEEKIKAQSAEIEQLSKIIHKDNKLIGALKLSINQFQSEMTNKQSRDLLKELEALTTERSEVLSSYAHNENTPAETGVFSIDIMLNYLSDKAAANQSAFKVSIVGDIRFMSEHVIDERDLSTLIADIGENALIAISTEETRKVLLLLGVENNHYHLDVYDSGAPFCKETIEMLGRKRYTTHKQNGGSGIGLMTVLELARKYNASFEIEEMMESASYKKRVSVVFDSLSQIRIYSEREDIISACKARPADIILLNK